MATRADSKADERHFAHASSTAPTRPTDSTSCAHGTLHIRQGEHRRVQAWLLACWARMCSMKGSGVRAYVLCERARAERTDATRLRPPASSKSLLGGGYPLPQAKRGSGSARLPRKRRHGFHKDPYPLGRMIGTHWSPTALKRGIALNCSVDRVPVRRMAPWPARTLAPPEAAAAADEKSPDHPRLCGRHRVHSHNAHSPRESRSDGPPQEWRAPSHRG